MACPMSGGHPPAPPSTAADVQEALERAVARPRRRVPRDTDTHDGSARRGTAAAPPPAPTRAARRAIAAGWRGPTAGSSSAPGRTTPSGGPPATHEGRPAAAAQVRPDAQSPGTQRAPSAQRSLRERVREQRGEGARNAELRTTVRLRGAQRSPDLPAAAWGGTRRTPGLPRIRSRRNFAAREHMIREEPVTSALLTARWGQCRGYREQCRTCGWCAAGCASRCVAA